MKEKKKLSKRATQKEGYHYAENYNVRIDIYEGHFLCS